MSTLRHRAILSKLSLPIILNVLFALSCLFARPACATDLGNWMNSTVVITNSQSKFGTGFFVKSRNKTFLVTNKHVIGTPKIQRQLEDLKLTFNKVLEKKFQKDTAPITLHGPNALPYNEHENPAVDVAAIDVTEFLKNHPEIFHDEIPDSLFGFLEVLDSESIDAGDDVLMIGYPVGYEPAESNFPMIKLGIIASKPDQATLTPDLDAERTKRPTMSPTASYYVSTLAIGGNSGGPVVLKPTPFHPNKRHNLTSEPLPPYLLGIQSQSTTDVHEIETSASTGSIQLPYVSRSFSGACIVFRVETIKHVIDKFFVK